MFYMNYLPNTRDFRGCFSLVPFQLFLQVYSWNELEKFRGLKTIDSDLLAMYSGQMISYECQLISLENNCVSA